MPSTREGEAALGRAIQQGDEDSVAALLAKGVDIERESHLCPAGMPVSPLMLAVKHEQAGCASLLLRAGAQRDRCFGPNKDTPLLISVSRGDVDTAKVLVEAGADLGQADAQGRSPLYMSCLMSYPSCTALLVYNDADLEQATTSINPGATALYAAALGHRCDCCSYRCIAILCEAGAVVDARSVQGATPMMVACQHGHLGMAMLLSSYGASRRPEVFDGSLPTTWWARDLADELGHEDVVEWLDASDDFTPLHHIEVLMPERTRRLLRTGVWSPVAGRPSAALRATNYLRRNPDDEAAKMIVRASQPWSPSTHALWSNEHRARVVELLEIGYQLRAKLAHGSVLDWWTTHVMPHAVAWDVVPPRRTEPKAKGKKTTKEQLEEPSGVLVTVRAPRRTSTSAGARRW